MRKLVALVAGIGLFAICGLVTAPNASASTPYGTTYKAWTDQWGRTNDLYVWLSIDYTNHRIRPYARNIESTYLSQFSVGATLLMDNNYIVINRETSSGHYGDWTQTTTGIWPCGSGGHLYTAYGVAGQLSGPYQSGDFPSGTANTAC
ncbi:MAG: hypothetical protein QOE05_1246 [Actinomycetota bacterium]|jgi:hypothetical protein|nr:hypothetical protein [Actinomycetota bacterium]